MISFTVLGTPVPKGRGRSTRRGITYTPAKTHQAEENFRAQAVPHRPPSPLDGAIELTVECELPIPPSWSNKKRERAITGELMPTGRPDADNLLKLCMDAMNGIFWRDDAQVVGITVKKSYGENPSTFVMIENYRDGGDRGLDPR